MSSHSKPFEQVTPAEYEENPVWEGAYDKEGVEDQDETWRRPLVGKRNVDETMIGPFIALRVVGAELPANAMYDHERQSICEIFVWWNGAWVLPEEALGSEVSVYYVALPSIAGQHSVRFLSQRSTDYYAQRESMS